MQNCKFDKETRSRLASLGEAELSSIIGEIANAVGADSTKARLLQNNLGGVREMLKKMTDAEAQKLIDSVGKEKADAILESLKRRY